MRSDFSQRLGRVLQTSSIVLGVVVACTVADKSDYEFTDEPAKGGGSNGGASGASGASGVSGSSSGTTGKGGSSGDGGMGGEDTGTGGSGTSGKGGTSGQGGSSGKGGTAGVGATAGDGGEETGGTSGTNGTGGSAGSGTGKCGDGNLDPGEDCDDHNTVTEPCMYGAATCGGCSAACRAIRPPSCGDNMQNGATPTSFVIDYLATTCATASGNPPAAPTVPLFFNGVPIQGLDWGTGCSCQPGPKSATVTDPQLLAAVRHDENVLSFLSRRADEYFAWANVTILFDNGARISRPAFDFGSPGDAETRNPGPTGPCSVPLPSSYFASGISDGPPFGGFPVEQCDGDQGCFACSRAQCVSITSTPGLGIPDGTTTGMPGVLFDSVLVPQLGIVRDVDVILNVTHPNDGDLGVQLRAVTNQEIMLIDRRGGVGDNFLGTVLDSQCTTPIANGLGPFNGCFAPDSSLDVFNGFPSTIGYWTLTLRDLVSNNLVGNLNSWTLRICGSP